MRRWAVVLSAFTISLGAATTVAGTAVAGPPDNDPYTLSNGHAGPMAGVVPSRDNNAGNPHGGGGGGGGSGPILLYHNGPVRHGTTIEPIYWGSSWKNYTGDKISGLQTFYQGLTGSGYATTNGEYTDTSGQKVDPSVTYQAALVDTSPAISRAPQTSDIYNEVVNVLAANGQTPQTGWYYPVYIDQPRGRAGYCAWHSSTISGTIFQFGFFFNLDGDGGCNPGNNAGHSQGLEALANVSGHEYSEMVTDPQLNAWTDSSGAENADKCAWTFNGIETLKNGSQWYIQGNWSNAAYKVQSGYANVGCINGN